MSEVEYVILVDETDTQIGLEEKLAAHKLKKLHRAFSVFIFRKKAGQLEVLLQQRHIDKYHCGGLWSNTCCSHPRPNEEVRDAGNRRLKEEMGIETKLYNVGSFQYKVDFDNGLTEHEYDHVLIGVYNETAFLVNPQEVQDFCWMNVADLRLRLKSHPIEYTPWFEQALGVALKSQDFIESLC